MARKPRKPAIIDTKGKPVDASNLTRELADASIMSIRQPWYSSAASGLTPERLAAIVAGVDSNNPHDYLTLAMEMEERDLHYSSVLSTRKNACTRLQLMVEAPSDDAEDKKIADYVAEIVNGEVFKTVLPQQLDAIGKGFSVSEIMWDRSEAQWEPKEFIWRDQRHFMFDRYTGLELRLRDEANMVEGLPLAPYKFVQHRPQLKMGLPIRGGLARLALIGFMCKSYTVKDWLAFIEVFGMPIRVGKYNDAATPEQKAKLLRAVANIGSDAAAIIPDSMMIEFVTATSNSSGGGGDKLFQGLADWWDSQISKAVLGQTMTTDNGSSLSQAKVHNEVRTDIRDADAEALASTLRHQIVKPIVDLNFGPRKSREYPILRLVFEEAEDLKSFSEAVTPFIDRGLKVSASEIRDKFGLEEPEDGEDILVPATKSAPTGAPPAPGEPNSLQGDTSTPPGASNDQSAPEPQDQIAEAHAKAIKEILALCVQGKELTKSQLALLATTRPPDDEIDKLTNDALRGWKKVMRPITNPLIELIQSATSYSDLQQKLNTVVLDPKHFVEALALLTFEARGMGDATDKVKP